MANKKIIYLVRDGAQPSISDWSNLQICLVGVASNHKEILVTKSKNKEIIYGMFYVLETLLKIVQSLNDKYYPLYRVWGINWPIIHNLSPDAVEVI